MIKSLYSLGLLRNGKVYSSKDLAYQAMRQSTPDLNDGVAKLCRYLGEDASGDTVVKTLIGFYANANEMEDNSGGQSYYTIIDIEGSAAEVEEIEEEVAKINESIGKGIDGTTLTDAINDINDKIGEGFDKDYTVADAINSVVEKSSVEINSSNSSISASSSSTSVGSVKYDLTTDASKISGLTAVSDSDEGAAKISGVTDTDSVKTGIKRLYDSLASEVSARKAAILNRTLESTNKAISISETPNGDGFNTSITLTLDGITNGVGNEKTGVDNAITITDNGLFLSSSWNCGDF